MFIEYIRKERLAKRQWDNGAAGISICQFTLPAPAEKIYLSFPTYDSKFALEVLFCLDGQMTAYRTNALPHDIEKDHILILSNTYGPYSLQVHTGFRGEMCIRDRAYLCVKSEKDLNREYALSGAKS